MRTFSQREATGAGDTTRTHSALVQGRPTKKPRGNDSPKEAATELPVSENLTSAKSLKATTIHIHLLKYSSDGSVYADSFARTDLYVLQIECLA